MDNTKDGLTMDVNDPDYQDFMRTIEIDDAFTEFFKPQDFMIENQVRGDSHQIEVPCGEQFSAPDQSGLKKGGDTIAARWCESDPISMPADTFLGSIKFLIGWRTGVPNVQGF